MFCQNCGKQYAENLNACPYCGTELQNNTPTEQQPVQQPAQQPVQQAAPVAQQPPVQQPPVQQPVQQPMQQSVQQPMQQPVQQPMQQPVQQPVYSATGAPNAYAQPYPMQAPPQKKKSKAGIIIGIVIAVIAIIAVVAVIAISSSKPEKKFYGEWKATMDYTDKCKEALGDDFKDYLGDDFKAQYDINVVFNKDGTYTIQADAESVSALKESLKQSVKNAFIKYCQEQYPQLSSLTDEQIIQAYESGSGESFDAVLDKAIDEMKFDTITKKDFEGQYKVDEEHFYLSAAKDKLVDETEYAVYEMKDDNTIEVKDYILDGKSNDVIFTLPCTLKKAK